MKYKRLVRSNKKDITAFYKIITIARLRIFMAIHIFMNLIKETKLKQRFVSPNIIAITLSC